MIVRCTKQNPSELRRAHKNGTSFLRGPKPAIPFVDLRANFKDHIDSLVKVGKVASQQT